MSSKTKVVIVDDAALIRRVFAKILEEDDELEVVGVAHDAPSAMKKIKELKPDVLVLDIVMPGMDGLSFLERLMKSRPMPVVMCSTLTEEGSPQAFRALELGAVEIIAKPKLDIHQNLIEIAPQIIDKVKAAAQSRFKTQHQLFSEPSKRPTPLVRRTPKSSGHSSQVGVVAIGCSTGGTDALLEVLLPLPLDIPGIVIVQHMPANFIRSFAKRLNRQCKIQVLEAENGALIRPGTALISPGDRHMSVSSGKDGYIVCLEETPLVNRHRPSVDVLFHSVAQCVGTKAVGVILTGMGKDGAAGMMAMKKAGALNIAQDKETCVVFGMPKMAIKAGGVDYVLPLGNISSQILKLVDQ